MGKIQQGDWLEAPFWQGTVQVINIHKKNKFDQITVHEEDTNRYETYIISENDYEKIKVISKATRGSLDFSGDPLKFRLGILSQRISMAPSIDPYYGLNASRIDPLPHQFEAVYEHLLARPITRALLAHDAGAGKTIMAGLIIKELKMRQRISRILIVAPAGLTGQWQRELTTKFAENFELVSSEYMAETKLDVFDAWRKTNYAITSIAFSRQKQIRKALETTEWDLVIVDEAHKMAAYKNPSGYIRKTEAYKLGEILSKRSKHFLLMTATPHKGDPDNYQLLISLLDANWGLAVANSSGSNPMVLRRTKEEMCKPNGDPLYPERIVDTLPFNLSKQEGELLEQVYKFIHDRYNIPKNSNRNGQIFALITLSRRMASCPYSLNQSLKRMREKALDLKDNRRDSNNELFDIDYFDLDELSEQERWEYESFAEEEAAVHLDIEKLDKLISKSESLIASGNQQKIKELKKACELWVGNRNEQLLIFTEFKDSLDYLIKCIEEWGYSTTKIHGGMTTQERRKAEKSFWKKEAQILIATEAAGEGINLQCCHVMINFDIPWNPNRLEQRMGRIHRYGQKAEKVYIYNLLAQNSMEDQVKNALIKKMKVMREDLGDKVFDVVGNILWGKELRELFERIATGEISAVDEAIKFIDGVEEPTRKAIQAENEISFTSSPINIEKFQKEQSKFSAYRLSPEISERFFKEGLEFIGGDFHEILLPSDNGEQFPAFQMELPSFYFDDFNKNKKYSFWPKICSDDEKEKNAVLFISPGHRIFDKLLDIIKKECRNDLEKGAVFFDLHPDKKSPYLIWFITSQVVDGLGRIIKRDINSFLHRADQENITPISTDIIEGFEYQNSIEVSEKIQLVKPMLEGQSEILVQSIQNHFLPKLEEIRKQHKKIIETDRRFLVSGLTRLINEMNDIAIDAFVNENLDEGNVISGKIDEAKSELADVKEMLRKAENLIMTNPFIQGIALVLPASESKNKEINISQGPNPVMHRDPEVEKAAMEIAMEFEKDADRNPKDVHIGNSWDLESYDTNGRVIRYIEVKGRGPKDAMEVSLTDPEWEASRRLGDQHWLYIIRLEDNKMITIQNPYEKLKPKELKRWVITINDAEIYSEEYRLN